MSEPALSHRPTGVRGAYPRLWRAGFRWLYLLDAIGILGVVVVVTLVRFGTDWPSPGDTVVGIPEIPLPDYLSQYADLPKVDEQLQQLRDVLAPYPQAKAPLDTLQTNVAIKLNEMAQTVALAKAGNVDEAVRTVRTDTGEKAMNEVMTFIDGLLKKPIKVGAQIISFGTIEYTDGPDKSIFVEVSNVF